MEPKTDYVSMSSADLKTALGDDAAKWAAAFKQHVEAYDPKRELDEGWLISWFANAIEHSSIVRRARTSG